MQQPELKIKRARGFLLPVAILVLVVVAIAVLALGNMTSADIRASSGHAQSEQAYFAATSGTEYARNLYLTGTACGAGLNATATVGPGSFTTSNATLYNVSTSSVNGSVTAAQTTIPVGTMGAYAPFGRIMIESEEMYYGAISGTNFINVQRGTSGTTAVVHLNGTVVRQYLCNLRSTGTVGSAKRVLSMNMSPQSYSQGTFTKKTSTGTQTIAGVGFQPTAVIFYWTQQTAAGTVTGASGGAGFATATAGFGASVAMVNAVHAANNACPAGQNNNRCSIEERQRSVTSPIIIFNNAVGPPAVVGKATLQSVNSDGFVLNWTTSDAAAYVINYIALGGDITNAFVGNFDMGTMSQCTNPAAPPANNSITGIGFEPNFVMFLNASDNTNDTSFPDANFSVGFALSSTARSANAFAAHNGVLQNTAIRPSYQQLTDHAILFLDQTANPPTANGQADFFSMDTNGFTICVNPVPNVGTAPRTVGYLALQGSPFFTGAFNQPTAIGTQNITSPGYRPQGVMAISRNLASGTTVGYGRSSIGSAGERTIANQSVWFQEGNVAANFASNTDMYTDATAALVTSRYLLSLGTSPNSTNTATAQLNSFLSRGFSLQWTAADAVTREVLYWTMGRDFADIQETYP
jgi:hypothetical protein